MNSKEHAQAGNALVQWFNSQEIGPSDARAIMCKVLATTLARGVTTRADANKAIDNLALQLVHDLNDQLYKNRHGGR